ncbi:hypothetical protein NS220_11410 [Microbacterium testaceum]|uniref:PucR C-terminal helix-turn-helix domain-containing protein n=1 Tax=Microbacterium testaceum TaxID=2033 RepID=A0A147EVU2_MICTE|nr:hypothetical protein [Microbacterium testaceum]KTR93745.1 hypothetical protein NS220_11410 [Microbacterium testaceum]
MKELAGRLRVLDPAASESVTIIDFFDSLVAGGAGVESVVRAAAILSGATAGAQVGERILGIDADGTRVIPEPPPEVADTGAPRVWLHRESGLAVNDAMIVDRAQVALAIITARADPTTSAVERVIDPGVSRVDRETAAHRLRLDGETRVVAAPPHSRHVTTASTVLATSEGAVWIGLGEVVPPDGPVGTSVARNLDDIPRACADARLALRLADERHRVVDAGDLGVLIGLARSFDRSGPRHPDLDVLDALDARTLDALDVVVDSESIRAAAARLSLHHSSLQSRHDTWTDQLGYDPLTPRGRARYLAARMLQRLR